MFGQFRYRWRAAKYASKDRAEISFLRSVLRKGDVAIDIGAHKGGYLFWLRAAVGHDGQVIAFEPQPLLADYLRKIVKRMRWWNVVVEWKGVSNVVGEMELHVPVRAGGVSPGASFERGKSKAERCENVRVATTTLDAYFLENNFGKIVRLIKVDVEGHELQVFRGAKQTLMDHRPILLFECEQRHHFGRPMTVVFDWLGELGMRGTFFGPDGKLQPIEAFDLARHQRVGTTPYCNNFVYRFY